MLQSFSIPVKQALWQIPAILVLAGSIAIATNQWRATGIPLVGNWSIEARFSDAAGESLIVTLEEARRLFGYGAALFVDARALGPYAEGHIAGAVHLPWEDAEPAFNRAMPRLLEGPQTIITYCDGETCDLSHQMALFLQQMGFEDVRILVNGWSVWREAGLPVETGGTTS